MGGLASLLASVAATDVAAIAQRVRRNAVFYGFIGLFVLTAYALAVAAAAVHLATLFGLPIALLSVAGGALLLALIVFVALKIANRAEEKRKREAALAHGSRALMATAAITALPLLMRSRPLLLAAFASGIGFMLTRGSGNGDGPVA